MEWEEVKAKLKEACGGIRGVFAEEDGAVACYVNYFKLSAREVEMGGLRWIDVEVEDREKFSKTLVSFTKVEGIKRRRDYFHIHGKTRRDAGVTLGRISGEPWVHVAVAV